jgi:hypothetical protein
MDIKKKVDFENLSSVKKMYLYIMNFIKKALITISDFFS